jgi:hypothetical protein
MPLTRRGEWPEAIQNEVEHARRLSPLVGSAGDDQDPSECCGHIDADVNFRGVGEGGMIVAPPTLVNAIEDALSPFGVRIYEQHLPPARILELIAAADPGQ